MRLVGPRQQGVSPTAMKQRERCPRNRDRNRSHNQSSEKPASAGLAWVPTDLQRVANGLQDEPRR